jgi:hypothetical protein
MERIPGFTPRRVAPGETAQARWDEAPRIHYFGCGNHREVLYPGETATTYCPKCGPGDESYAGWSEKLRPSWRP